MDTIKAANPSTQPAPATRAPVLLTAVGRQRTGETALLNAVAEMVTRQGGSPEIWNSDLLNVTHSISRFHRGVLQPADATQEEQRKWLEARIQDLRTRRQDVILDIGGGWTAFHEILDNTPLMPGLLKAGIKVVIVYMMGTGLADVDYLKDLSANRNFLASNSLIVLNEGLIPPGASRKTAFSKIMQTETVINAAAGGTSNGVVLQTYVERVLVPTLRSGDIVILDNLPAHRMPGARRAVERAGATMVFLPPYTPTSIRSRWPSPSSNRLCAAGQNAPSPPYGMLSETCLRPSPQQSAPTSSQPPDMNQINVETL